MRNITKRATMRMGGSSSPAAGGASNAGAPRSTTRRATLNMLTADSLSPGDVGRSRDDWITVLVSEERSYVSELGVLHDVYTEPLKVDMNSPRPRYLQGNPTMNVFLNNVDHIYNLNQNFLTELSRRVDEGGHVGDVLARFAPLFKMYGQYGSSHDEVLAIISESMSSNQRFAEFISEAESDPRSRGHNIRTLAGTPLRRIPRYITILNHIVQLTEDGHPDKTQITGALGQMETTMAHIRTQIEQREATEVIMALEANWDVQFVKNRRRLVHQGLLTKVSRRKDIAYMFLLFNDVIVYGAAQGTRFTHHRTMSLKNMRIDDVPQSGETAFQIMSEKSFVVKAATQQDKVDWMVAISEAVSSYQDDDADDSEAALAPVWVPDSNATGCAICDAKFTLVRRRHHCRKCGICVCDGCSPERFPMNLLVKSSTETTMMRACRRCAIAITNEANAPPPSAASASSAAGRPRPSTSSPRHPSTATRGDIKCKALFAYAADDEGQLELHEGEVLVVLDREEEWWFGHREGDANATGWFPANHVQDLPSSSSSSSSSPSSSSSSSGAPSAALAAAEASNVAAIEAREKEVAARQAKADQTARTNVVQEILSTERTYVSRLEALFEVYIAPLLADGESSKRTIGRIVDVASPNNLTSMAVFFHNVEHMLTLNRQLLADLETRVGGWTDDRTMGDIFVQYGPLFSMYAQYSNSQEFAGSTITHWAETKPAFAAFLEEANADPRAMGQNIHSMLIEPIQRVPRYQLLLAELHKQTSKKTPDHPDLVQLDLALNEVKDSAMVINDQIKIRENREKIQELERQWGGISLDKAGRMFKRQGPLQKQCRRAPKQFEFLLFSDALVYGERAATGDSVKYHRTISLKECQVQELPSSPVGFQIASTSKSFVAMADTPAAALKWREDIQACIEGLRRDGETQASVAPVWVPDAHATRCTFCQDSFTAFKRRHHCRVCGAVACDGCSSARRLVPNVDPNRKVRVCDPCAKTQDDQGSVAGSGGFAAAGETAAKAAASSGGGPAHWVANADAAACLVCNTKFSVARRRHHCRCCGQVVCDPCTNSCDLSPLNVHGENKFSTKPVRTCRTCQTQKLSQGPPPIPARATTTTAAAMTAGAGAGAGAPPMPAAQLAGAVAAAAAEMRGGGAAEVPPESDSESDEDDDGLVAPELTLPCDCVSQYPYVATEVNELSLTEGCRIHVTESNGDWLFGTIVGGQEGQDGWFPRLYVAAA